VPTPLPTPASKANFEIRKSASCGQAVTSMAECGQAAAELGLSDTTPSDDKQRGVSYDPPFCYFEGNSLKFNSNGLNTGRCTTSDNCLCSLAPTPAPTPMPTKPAAGACSFESTYCGIWYNAGGDDFDWSMGKHGTPSSRTGPSEAADGDYYIFIETSSPRRSGDKAILKSGPLAVAPGTTMTFSYNMNGATINKLTVKAGDDELFTKTGSQGNAWHTATVDVPSGNPTEISFQGVRGTSYTGDIAIDNVSFAIGDGVDSS